ncbi:NADPH-dependent FMN reductase [Marinilactibacillus kalidii]|uniref:NADPH-dependent FMN reductase n=1 Tax=Marinilactibacillus kalidii TaxID=2820274 RepID=UPI001ABE4FB2|nr:NAD(P)H-dependent oxidoreductase [Marinilactibacillus kalidii]
MTEQLKIGIVLGSNRQGRVSPQVGEWAKKLADQRNDAQYEIVDIADYDLPFFGTTAGTEPDLAKWSEKINELDAYIFVVAEYNHGMTGVLKNAIDSAPTTAWNNKAASIMSYGSTGGARAAEHLRGVLGELMVADTRVHPTFSLFLDFENFTTFNPGELHLENMNMMFDQLNSWGTALKSVRG